MIYRVRGFGIDPCRILFCFIRPQMLLLYYVRRSRSLILGVGFLDEAFCPSYRTFPKLLLLFLCPVSRYRHTQT